MEWVKGGGRGPAPPPVAGSAPHLLAGRYVARRDKHDGAPAAPRPGGAEGERAARAGGAAVVEAVDGCACEVVCWGW